MFIQFFKENKFLYFFLTFYFLLGGILLTQIQKGDVVIWFNQHHTEFLDYFFKYATKLGEEFFLLGFVFMLIFQKKYYLSVLLVVNVLVNGAIIQLLKHFVFDDFKRPIAILGEGTYHFVEGVRIHSHNSFPSGHTNTAFVFFLLLAIFSKSSLSKILIALVAIIVGLSRVYLFEHFFVDTYVGGMIGVILTTIFYVCIENYTSLKERLSKN